MPEVPDNAGENFVLQSIPAYQNPIYHIDLSCMWLDSFACYTGSDLLRHWFGHTDNLHVVRMP